MNTRRQSFEDARRIAFPTTERRLNPVHDFLIGVELSQRHGALDPRDVITCLRASRIDSVLVGTHCINPRGGKPRTTIDVDLIVSDPEQAADVLLESFNHLTRSETPLMLKLQNGSVDCIDLLKPTANELFGTVLSETEVLDVDGVLIVLPTVEATLALKFAAYRTVNRGMADRYQDVHDLMLVSQLHAQIDEEKIRSLGDRVGSNAGVFFLGDIEDARSEKRIDFSRGL